MATQEPDAKEPAATPAPLFGRLERRSMVTETTRMIKGMIIDGRLRPGDRLPPERALCEALSVSRPTLREATTSLVAMKILIAQPGSGTFVSSLDLQDLLEPMQFALELAHSNLDQLFEARCMLEPQAAAFAAERAGVDELAALKACIVRTKAWRDDLEALLQLDQELHRLVVEATHNGILVNVLASMNSLADASRRVTVNLPGISRQTTKDHIRIGTAVLEGDADGARLSMEQHLRGIQKRVRAANAGAARVSGLTSSLPGAAEPSGTKTTRGKSRITEKDDS